MFFSSFQELTVQKVTIFVAELREAVNDSANKIINSSATILTIVNILNNIANVSGNVSKTVMQVNLPFCKLAVKVLSIKITF